MKNKWHSNTNPGFGQYFTHNYAFIFAGVQVYQVIFFASRDKGEITRECHAISRVPQSLKVLFMTSGFVIWKDHKPEEEKQTQLTAAVEVTLSCCPILPERR